MPTSVGIDLRHLRYFLAVFEELHFGRAAQRLHIAQPPLSQAIRKLEQDLGVTLFERTSRAVKATSAGAALAEEARKVLASFDFAVAEVRRVGTADSPLRIGWVSYVPTRRLRRFLAALKEHDADLRTEVTHLHGLQQVGRLRAGDLDIGVLAHAEDYDDLEWEPLFQGEPLNVFLPQGHPLSGREVVTPADLAGETLLTYPRDVNPAFYDTGMTMLERAGYRFANLYETNSDPSDVLLAVAGGLGVTVAPASLSEASEVGRDVIRRALDPELWFPETIVAWRASPPRHVLGRLDAVRDVARELRDETARA